MKYEYITATGKTEIDADGQFYDLLIALDKEEYNANRKHSRRNPIALEDADYEGEWFSDDADLLRDIIRSENEVRLHTALHLLTPKQQTLVDRVYFKNEKIVDIAHADGVSEAAVRNRLKKIYHRLKIFLN